MYTNIPLIENFLQRALSENEQAFLGALIPAITTWLNRKLGTSFEEVSATTRYFDGGSATIDIDPCYDITEIKSINNDGTDSYIYTTGTEYVAEPQNTTIKNELRRRYGHFPKGAGRIAVTAKFSENEDPGIPYDIQTAATIMAAEVLNQGKIASSGGNVASESLEGHSVTYDTSSTALDGISGSNPNVRSILDLRKQLWVG